MRRYTLVVLLGILVFAATMAPAEAKTTVRVFSWWTPDPGSLLDLLKRSFEAENPDYNIDFSTVPSSQYYDQLQVMTAAGDPPEVAMLGFDWIAPLAESKLITNIDTLVRRSFPYQELFPPVQRAVQWKGQYYALPRDITSRVFYYNKTQLRESGVSFPAANWKWNDFLSLARKVHKSDGNKVTRWGFMMDFTRDGHYHWFPTNSADWFNASRTQVTMTEPRTIETLQFLQDLVYVHGVTGTPDQRNALKNAGNAFLTQSAAMQIGGSGVPDKAQFPDLDWGLADLPYNTQPGTRIWANLWVIPAGVKNIDAAWKVLSYFAGMKGQKIAGEAKSGIPALRRVAAEMKYDHEYRDVLLRGFEIGVPFPVIANTKVWTVFDAELGKFWRNAYPAKTVAENIQRQTLPLMEQ